MEHNQMYELKVVTKFAAAHQLTMVGSKCENMHGHNWKIEVQSQPSSENIACLVAGKLQQRIDNPSVRISRVTAWESDDASATYIV